MATESSKKDRGEIQRVAVELAAGGRSGGDLLRITVTGSSMRPTLRPGDVILVRPGASPEIKPGALVTFLTDAGPVTHRVVGLTGSGLIAKGDNSRRFDAPISPSRVIGRVVSSVRGGVERPFRTGARAVWTARLSYLEGRWAERFNPDRQTSLYTKLVGLPFRILITIFTAPRLSR